MSCVLALRSTLSTMRLPSAPLSTSVAETTKTRERLWVEELEKEEATSKASLRAVYILRAYIRKWMSLGNDRFGGLAMHRHWLSKLQHGKEKRKQKKLNNVKDIYSGDRW